jgi:oxygen-independent coproporphyrinogen III oxidase
MSGLYLHIPFCRKRCTYCDFHFSTTFENYRSDLISALIRELILRSSESKGPLQTIYFGGGTPSILTPLELSLIFETIGQNYIVAPDAEISFEANPEDINLENLASWKATGINRLSVGLQTFSDEDLHWMNRAHKVQDGLEGIKLAQKLGFDNISVDLIYGLPGQSLDAWEASLAAVFELRVQHLSAYCLTIEPRTTLNHLVSKKKLQPADEVLQSEQFLTLIAKAKAFGFEQYEISNFSLPGFHSEHNSSYWKFQDYIGIGPSAHSFDGTQRRWNVRNNTAYTKSVGKNDNWFECEILSENECRNEQILLGLRTTWGLDLTTLKEGFTSKENAQIEEFTRLNWMKLKDQKMILTEEGKLHADGIAAALFRLD